MSHGVHAVQHEVEHQIEHEEHGHGGGRRKPLGERTNKKIARLISVLALFLAFSETLGKKSQTQAISLNIKASDTWNFFQAKTIRQTTLRTAAERIRVEADITTDEARRTALLKQADDWMKTVALYESNPAERDGRKELRALAERREHERDTYLARYHHYELALPDRHRPGIGGRHHRHDGADLHCGRSRHRRIDLHGTGVFRARLSTLAKLGLTAVTLLTSAGGMRQYPQCTPGNP